MLTMLAAKQAAEMVKEHLNAQLTVTQFIRNCFLTRANMFFTKKAKALSRAMRQKRKPEAEKKITIRCYRFIALWPASLPFYEALFLFTYKHCL